MISSSAPASGPRAYAIIEQGMISRVIEAKPEELRIFLEEAAGVSKYKERRKETEGRISDTREKSRARRGHPHRARCAADESSRRRRSVATDYKEHEARAKESSTSSRSRSSRTPTTRASAMRQPSRRRIAAFEVLPADVRAAERGRRRCGRSRARRDALHEKQGGILHRHFRSDGLDHSSPSRANPRRDRPRSRAAHRADRRAGRAGGVARRGRHRGGACARRRADGAKPPAPRKRTPRRHSRRWGRRSPTRHASRRGAAADRAGRAVDRWWLNAPRARRARPRAASGTAPAPRRGIAHAVDHRDRAGRRRRRAAAPGAGGARRQRIRSQRAARHGTGTAGARACRKRSRTRRPGRRLADLQPRASALSACRTRSATARTARRGLRRRPHAGAPAVAGHRHRARLRRTCSKRAANERLNAIERRSSQCRAALGRRRRGRQGAGPAGRIAAYSPKAANAPAGPSDALLARCALRDPGWRASWPTGCAASAAGPASPRRCARVASWTSAKRSSRPRGTSSAPMPSRSSRRTANCRRARAAARARRARAGDRRRPRRGDGRACRARRARDGTGTSADPVPRREPLVYVAAAALPRPRARAPPALQGGRGRREAAPANRGGTRRDRDAGRRGARAGGVVPRRRAHRGCGASQRGNGQAGRAAPRPQRGRCRAGARPRARPHRRACRTGGRLRRAQLPRPHRRARRAR